MDKRTAKRQACSYTAVMLRNAIEQIGDVLEEYEDERDAYRFRRACAELVEELERRADGG